MIRIPSTAGVLGKLPVEIPDTPCVDDNGLPSFIDDNGNCALAKCPPDFAACDGACVGCGPFATINLNDCGCDCLPGYVPADVETPGAGCMKTYDSAGVVYYDPGAPGGRPPGGIAPPLVQITSQPGANDAGGAPGAGPAAEDNSGRNLLIGAGVVAAGVALLVWRPWK